MTRTRSFSADWTASRFSTQASRLDRSWLLTRRNDSYRRFVWGPARASVRSDLATKDALRSRFERNAYYSRTSAM